MPPIRLALALAGLVLLAACATPAAEPIASPDGEAIPEFAPAPPPPPMDAPPAAEEPAMSCNAEPGQWALGQVADETLVARVRADTGADRVRVIRPGMAVTMDWRKDRVNLDVDDGNRVLAVRCG